MKTRTLVLKHQLTVKYLIFWPRGQLLVEKTKKTTTTTNLTRSRRKKTSKSHPTPSEIATFWTPPPPPLRIFVALRGEGMAIFWNYTIHVLFTWKIEVMKSWILTWLQLEDKNGIHWTKIKGAYFVAKVTCNVENYHNDFSLITWHLFHVIAIRTTVDE